MYFLFLLVLAIATIVILTTKFQVHPFLALLAAAIGFAVLSGMPFFLIVTSINEGFGNTLGKIGLVIIIGVIIGEFLEKSGGAFAMAEKILKIIGPKNVATAMALTGWIVAIPVFADSAFIILSPLNKSLSKRAGISLTGPAIALGLGLFTTHCMVPPTPGPIGAAGILDANLGLVILWSLPVSFVAMIAGLFYAKKYASKIYIDPAPKISEEEVRDLMKDAPVAFHAFIPILLPIILIVIKSMIPDQLPTDEYTVITVIDFIGEPVIALLIGMLVAFTLPKKFDKSMLSTSGWVGKSLTSASIIILITGAGGVFGKILQNAHAGVIFRSLFEGVHIGLLLPFLLAAAIKTAQGSSTVAMITSASILLPLMSTLGFESETSKALVVVSIGAGAMVVSHANDSLFWVITQMTGMNVSTGFRLYTVGSLFIGMVALVTLLLIAAFI